MFSNLITNNICYSLIETIKLANKIIMEIG